MAGLAAERKILEKRWKSQQDPCLVCWKQRGLFCKKAIRVRHGLKLDGIARRIQEKHGGLLTNLALKPNVGLNHKLRTRLGQSVGKALPFRHGEHHAKMTHWNVVAIDRVFSAMTGLPFGQVGNNLVAVKIKVNPFLGASTLGAAQEPTVKVTGLLKIVNGKGKVERMRNRRGLHG
jgi:hypothetical protein